MIGDNGTVSTIAQRKEQQQQIVEEQASRQTNKQATSKACAKDQGYRMCLMYN